MDLRSDYKCPVVILTTGQSFIFYFLKKLDTPFLAILFSADLNFIWIYDRMNTINVGINQAQYSNVYPCLKAYTNSILLRKISVPISLYAIIKKQKDPIENDIRLAIIPTNANTSFIVSLSISFTSII